LFARRSGFIGKTMTKHFTTILGNMQVLKNISSKTAIPLSAFNPGCAFFHAVVRPDHGAALISDFSKERVI